MPSIKRKVSTFILNKARNYPFLTRTEDTIKRECLIYDSSKESDLEESYKYLKESFKECYEFIKENTDLVIEPYNQEGQPYESSKEMFEDIENNNHYYYFKTESTTDSNGENSVNEYMLESHDGVFYNDIFRIVHDIIGHYAFSFNFSQRGEVRAWRIHRSLMDKKGWPALWTETRGQNASFYYGKYKDIDIKERPFPPQKMVRPPEEYL